MNLKPLILSGFKRVNDKVAPDLLEQDEAAVMQDLVLDYKIGKPVKRGYFSRYDAGIDAGYDIDRIDDIDINGTVSPVVITNDGANSQVSLYDVSGNVFNGYIGSLTAGAKFKKIPFGDYYIWVFDTDDDPRITAKTGGTVFNLEIPAADVTSIRSYHATGGNLTQNTHYRYVMVGLTEDGQIGHVSKPFTHYCNTGRFVTTDNDTVSTKILFKDLPYIADARVVNRMILRTKGESQLSAAYNLGSVFYLLTILDNDSGGSEYQTEFFDNVADDDLGTEIAIFINMPTRSKHIAFSNERLFLGNFSQYDKNFISPPDTNTGVDGTHTGSNNASALTDTNASFVVNELVGRVIHNLTDGSSGTITANTATVVTATLSGGTEDDWDTNDEYVILPSGYATASYELSATADRSGGTGKLSDSQQYDYRIHYEDKYGRLSEHYIEVTANTGAGGGSNDWDITVAGIGSLSEVAAEEYPNVVIFRRTGGAGSYYLIARTNIRENYVTTLRRGGWSWIRTGNFVDYGAPNLTETWVDPEASANLKSFPSAITFSEISKPSSIRDEDKRQIFFDDGDEVTGMFDDQEGLIIFKDNNINKLFLSGNPNNWRLVKLVKDYGCDQEYTLQISGNSYYFIHVDRAYRYDYGAEKPVEIGELFYDTLKTVTTWYDSAINDRWWLLQCLIGTTYYTLVWDIRMQTWYKFKRTKSASEDFKTLHIGQYGSLKDQIFSNCDGRITIYNDLDAASPDLRADTETGGSIAIDTSITTKTFKFPDGITKARLRKLKFDYKKVNGVDARILITDQDTGTSLTKTDSTGSGKKLYEVGIGTDSDTLKKTRAFNINVTSFLEWDNLRIEYRPIREGKQVSM